MGPVHEGFHTLQVAESETGDESTRDLKISMEYGEPAIMDYIWRGGLQTHRICSCRSLGLKCDVYGVDYI